MITSTHVQVPVHLLASSPGPLSCNIEKLGEWAWGRGYTSTVLMTIDSPQEAAW